MADFFEADAGTRTVIFSIARMNPPTSGHLKLIQTMMTAASYLPKDDPGHKQIYIILSHSQDNIKNPLTCKRKREILNTEGMIQHIKTIEPLLNDINVNIFCMDDVAPESCGKHPILKQVCHIIMLEQPNRMKLFIGEDRADSYTFVKTDIAKQHPQIDLEMVVLPRPEGAMSATFMRGLVTDGKKAEFIQAAVENGLSVENAEALFDELDYVMKTPVVTKRRKQVAGRKTRRGKTRRGKTRRGKTMRGKTRRLKNKRSSNKKRSFHKKRRSHKRKL